MPPPLWVVDVTMQAAIEFLVWLLAPQARSNRMTPDLLGQHWLSVGWVALFLVGVPLWAWAGRERTEP